MIRKLKAVVRAGILGTVAGSVFGLWVWLLSWLPVGSARVLPFRETVLNAGLLGACTGTLFAAGLTLYARVRGEVVFSERLASVLGASMGALAFPIVVFLRQADEPSAPDHVVIQVPRLLDEEFSWRAPRSKDRDPAERGSSRAG